MIGRPDRQDGGLQSLHTVQLGSGRPLVARPGFGRSVAALLGQWLRRVTGRGRDEVPPRQQD
ncbi:MAG: hypothetical protein ACRC8U_10855, partial [Brooklawnia sp.]